MKLRITSIVISLAVLLGIVGHFLYVIPDTTAIPAALLRFGLPPLISLILAAICRRPASLIILAAASLLYGTWFISMASAISQIPQNDHAVIDTFLSFVLLIFFILPVLLTMLIVVTFLEISRLLTKKKPSS